MLNLNQPLLIIKTQLAVEFIDMCAPQGLVLVKAIDDNDLYWVEVRELENYDPCKILNGLNLEKPIRIKKTLTPVTFNGTASGNMMFVTFQDGVISYSSWIESTHLENYEPNADNQCCC